jgi:OmpA-OmpF porin, OOP family
MQYNHKSFMNKKYCFALVAAILFGTMYANSIHAQTGERGYYVQAEKLFKQKKYYEAIQYYEKYLGTEKKPVSRSQPFAVQKKVTGKSNLNVHNESVYHLAESYRHLNNYTKAEKLYKEASGYSRSAYPECLYWYGVSLRSNQKYDEALTAFTNFRAKYTTMNELLRGADRELENLQYIKQQLSKNKQGFFVTPVKTTDNVSAYAMSNTADNKIVFTSFAGDTSSGSKNGQAYKAVLFESAATESVIDKKEKISIPAQEGIHDGLATFNQRGDKMLFTRWTDINGVKTAAIFKSEKSDTGWTKPVKLGEPINEEGANTAQPFITNDGKYLLFSSDRKGGVGKYDIWYATVDSNLNPLMVTNVGNIVNTAEDEVSPSYHQTSRTLLFSSNGFIGMGGFDVFFAKGDFQLLNWNKPQDAGTPINSSKDDLYYIPTDEDNLWNTGIFSSDRSTDCCLEMFAVKQDNAQLISGSVVDCKTREPLQNVALTVTDPKHGGKILLTQKTDIAGTYQFELKNTSRFDIKAESEGYESDIQTYTAYFDTGKNTFKNDVICLNLISRKVNEKLQAKLTEITQITDAATLAQFSYNKSALGNGSYQQLDSLISFMEQNPSAIIEIGGYTDTKGSEEYNIKLAQKRVDACIAYLIKKGINKDRLTGKAYGECCPLEPEEINGEDNPAARERNRRVEYKLVQ